MRDDHEGRRKIVAVKREKTTLVANMKQYAMMRARQEEAYQELHEVVKLMDDKRRKLLAVVGRGLCLVGGAPGALREGGRRGGGGVLQEIRGLHERIFGEKIAGEKDGLGGNVERKEECRSGSRERFSLCWTWFHSEGGLEPPKRRVISFRLEVEHVRRKSYTRTQLPLLGECHTDDGSWVRASNFREWRVIFLSM